MNSAKRFFMVAGAFALATLTFTLANPKAVHAFAATLVQVVNPVAIDPANNSVQIANTPTVNVNSLPGVQVSNLPADHAVQAVVLSAHITIGSGLLGTSAILQSNSSDFIVPNGKRFVMQSVSIAGLTPSDQHLVELEIETITTMQGGSANLPHFVAPVLTDTSNGNLYQFTQQITAYSDSGFPVQVFASRNVNSSNASFVLFIVSGYLVDCPNGSCPVQP